MDDDDDSAASVCKDGFNLVKQDGPWVNVFKLDVGVGSVFVSLGEKTFWSKERWEALSLERGNVL